MTSEHGRRTPRDGFTLIEVLFAFLILSFGLLGVQALAAGSSRLVTRAERQGEYMTLASTQMEATMRTLRRGTPPAGTTTTDTPIPGAVMRTVVTPGTATSGSVRLYTIEVRITPTAANAVRQAPLRTADTFTLTGNVYR